MENSIRNRRQRRKIARTASVEPDQEVSSIEWKFITMTEQEEDLIRRMFRLVGERWDLIAGRVPGRTAEEIERFWIMRNHEMFADIRKKHSKSQDSKPQTETVLGFFESLNES